MRRVGWTAALAAAASMSAACGSEVTSTSGGTGGDGGSAPTSGQGATGGGGPSGPSGTSGTTGPGGGSGSMCGGFGGIACPPNEFCDYPDDICGAADGGGVCRTRPTACPEYYSPTCACDGKVYGNPCDANGAGFDVSNLGSCPAPQGQFSCGSTFCNTALEYCEKQTSDIGGEPDSYGCKPVPSQCGKTPTCPCLAGEPCGYNCEQVGLAQLKVTCPGG